MKSNIEHHSTETFLYDDGGREQSGYKGVTGDCVTRAIAIATGKPYQEVYDALNAMAEDEKITKCKRKKSNSRTGVYRVTYQKYLESIGWKWIACMEIGKGCQTHLKSEELPKGKIICRLSKHLCAVVDGVIHDIYDPSRDGSRCVYGYFIEK